MAAGTSTRYREGDVVEGRVAKVVTFGAFVEILPGVEGLVHISELAAHHVENPREVVQQGQAVNVRVLEIDGERRRLSLSLKRVEEGEQPVPRADGAESVHTTPGSEADRGGVPVRSAQQRSPEDVEEPSEAVEASSEPSARSHSWTSRSSPRRRTRSWYSSSEAEPETDEPDVEELSRKPKSLVEAEADAEVVVDEPSEPADESRRGRVDRALAASDPAVEPAPSRSRLPLPEGSAPARRTALDSASGGTARRPCRATRSSTTCSRTDPDVRQALVERFGEDDPRRQTAYPIESGSRFRVFT